MRRGERLRRIVAVAMLSGGTLVAATTSDASPALSASASTLTLSLPGPFNGCSALAPQASASTTSILDLIRPSAFLTSPSDTLVGESGAFLSAELTSLTPETVVYSLNPGLKWSDGRPFDGTDLVTWWHKARSLPSVVSDGYRDISSMVQSDDGMTVTTIFRRPFAEWNLLFRDVEAATSNTADCSAASLLHRPSLGPYRVSAASTERIVLTSNPSWSANFNRFHTVILTSNPTLPRNANTLFASYQLNVTASQVSALSNHPLLQGHIGYSSENEEVAFAPDRGDTSSTPMREALSWLLNRQGILDKLYGAVTFTPTVASSILFSQGQSGYPASPSTPNVSTGAQASPAVDCRPCALSLLAHLGFHRTATGWRHGATRLVLSLARGPSQLDQATASQIAGQWRALGVGVDESAAGSDQLAAHEVATDAVDVAVFTRPTSSTPWFSARSWSGAAYADSYYSGIRIPSVSARFTVATATFNPVSAQATWSSIDQTLLASFWVRPLFTAPSLTEWSPRLANVATSLSIPGLVDQVSNWGVATSSAAG